jgi:hypothetical protein
MRSELVYSAVLRVENRFLLASAAMVAVRRLHVDATRTEDTINRVLSEVADSVTGIGEVPDVPPPPVIDELIIALAAS